MKFLPEILTVICVATYLPIYLIGIRKGKVKPILATWLFFSLASILSIITDFHETGARGLLANSYNIFDASSGIIIFVFVLFQKNTRRQFNSFEKWCVGAVLIVGTLWLVSGQNVLAHITVQIIMFIGYLPMVVHLWRATVNTESLSMWSLDFLASIFGSIRSIGSGAFLPIVYSVRSLISAFTVVMLILRLKYYKKSEAAV